MEEETTVYVCPICTKDGASLDPFTKDGSVDWCPGHFSDGSGRIWPDHKSIPDTPDCYTVPKGTGGLDHTVSDLESPNGYSSELVADVRGLTESVLKLPRKGLKLMFKLRLGDQIAIDIDATPNDGDQDDEAKS